MCPSRFVKPEVTRLYLADVHKRAHEELLAIGKATKEAVRASEANVSAAISAGDYIDVKRRLNTGEQQDLFERMAPHMTAGEKVNLESKAVMTAKVLAYLLTWSFTDDGRPVPMLPEPDMSYQVRLSTLRSLDPESFREIRQAVEAHEDAVEKEIADSKNVQATPLVSVAI